MRHFCQTYRILFFVLSLFFHSTDFYAQNIGVNQTGVAPDQSAALDIDFYDKGILIPRVHLLSTTDVVTISSPAISLMVYNTNATMIDGDVGFYYFGGSEWIPFVQQTTNNTNLQIGDYYGGGIIFDLSTDNEGKQHGLIVDLIDLSGKTSKDIIVQSKPCESSKRGGHYDWFLPTQVHWGLLYSQKSIVNIALGDISGATLIANDWYWCSNATSSNYQYNYNFTNGAAATSIIQSQGRIRAIRRF